MNPGNAGTVEMFNRKWLGFVVVVDTVATGDGPFAVQCVSV